MFFVIRRMRLLFGWKLGRRTWSDKDRIRDIDHSKDGTINRRLEGIRQVNGLPFIITREYFYHRTLKRMGIATELQVGDEEFDRRYYIVTDFPSTLEAACRDSIFLDRVKELLALPVESIHATRTRLWCEISPKDFKQADAHFDQHAALLGAIGIALRNEARKMPVRRNRQMMGWAFSFMAVHSALLAYGFWWMIPLIADEEQLLEPKKMLGITLLAIPVAIFVWWRAILFFFRKTSWAGLVVADFIFVGLTGFVLGGSLIVREMNIALPQVASVPASVTVTDRVCYLHCSKGKGGHRYLIQESQCTPEARESTRRAYQNTYDKCQKNNYIYSLKTSPLGERKTPFSFDIWDDGFYDASQRGVILSVPVWPGALGVKWVNTKLIGPARTTY